MIFKNLLFLLKILNLVNIKIIMYLNRNSDECFIDIQNTIFKLI